VNDVAVGDVLDQYRITALIARGVTASIFKAVDPRSGVTVTLKVPHLAYGGDPVFHAHFQREGQIGRRLDHPRILKVLPPETQSRVYIVTEYVDGVPLRSLLRPGQPLETRQALDIARQIAAALIYLHGEQVVHRDLKPENILITRDGGIKILDFGIALDHPGRGFTWLGSTPMGTPDYMAPEQARGLRGDARSDICALGVILYEMLTGALPYPGDGPFDVMQCKLGSDPIPPTRFRPNLDPKLEEIVLHAIERSPKQRTATAADLLADLQNPARVRPTGRGARLRPRTLREQLVRRIAVLVVGALFIVVGLVALVWLANRYPVPPGAR
jgi:eukaryotic-like serine/threonine-protein kinase